MSTGQIQRSKTMYSDARQKLLEAAMEGNTQVLEQLVDQQPNILEAEYDDGQTACHFAVQSGHFDFAVKVSQGHPPLLYRQNKTTRDTPLHLALTCHPPAGFFRSCLQVLLDYFGGTFDWIGGHDGSMEASLFRDNVVNAQGKSLIYKAVEKGNIEAVELMLTNPPLDNCGGPLGMNAMHAAVKARDLDMLKILLKYKPGLTKYAHSDTYNKPLHLAVYYNEPEMVRQLLHSDVTDVETRNCKGMSPVLIAAANGQMEIFEMFIKYYPHSHKALTYTDLNALHLAVINKVESIVKFIAEDSVLSEMINRQDQDGDTPLHIASANGYANLLDILLDSAVTVHPLKNTAGKTFQDLNLERKERAHKEKTKKRQSRLVEAMKTFQGSLLTMATLIITVTFAAAFTLPGGYNGSDPNQGMATFVTRPGFKVFVISNAISMGSAIIATAAFILYSMVFNIKEQYKTLTIGILAVAVSIVFMLVTFAAGAWLVIASQCRWLANLIAIVMSCILASLAVLVAHILLGYGIEVDGDDKLENEKMGKIEKSPII